MTSEPDKAIEPQISHGERRDRLAQGIYAYWNPGSSWADAHADDVLAYRADADAAMTVADALAGQGMAPRAAADIYREVAARLTLFSEFSTPEWASYCRFAAGKVDEWATQTDTASSPEPACLCGHREQQHFEDACLAACGCKDFLTAEAAVEEIARLRQAVRQAPATVAADAALREAEGEHALAEYGWELARLIRPAGPSRVADEAQHAERQAS